jgi:DNA-binding CsgD family transcriptional regulator
MSKDKPSWLNYMRQLQIRQINPAEVDSSNVERVLRLNQFDANTFNHSIPWIYMLDYTTGKYTVVSQSVKTMMGYDPDYFLDGGLDLILQQYHRSHLKLFNEEIFPDRLETLRQIPPEEHPNYIFTYNMKVKSAKGEYLNLLQRNCFIRSDEHGNPLLSFGSITNITHYKSENPIVHLVEKVDKNASIPEPTLFSKKTYYIHKESSVFSRRELEVLKWTIDGLTHKEIADRLNLAQGTVLLHRKHMLAKSSTRNVAELVAYAFRNQLV